MASFSGLGIGLSFVFGCIFLGLIVELYYLLWWKERFSKKREIIGGVDEDSSEFNSPTKEISHLFCWRGWIYRRSRSNRSNSSIQELNGNDVELGGESKKDSFRGGEESVESELMRLHNLCGPPRFLFTIKEETKEDLDAFEDGKSSRKGSRTRSLSDIILAVESLSPLPCSPLKPQCLDVYSNHGFNPLFESISEGELNKLRSSPPPKFKFLRDAEEKLLKRLMEEAEKKEKLERNATLQEPEEVTNGSFISFIGKSKEREANLQLQRSNQVLPLP